MYAVYPRQSPDEGELVPLDTLARIFEHTAVGVMGFDPSGRVLLWNKTASDLFGYSTQQVMTHRCFELVNGCDARGNLLCHAGCSIMLMFRHGRPPNDYLLRAQSADERSLLLNVSTVFVDTETSPVCLHLFHDVRWMGEVPAGEPRRQPEAAPSPLITLTAREREILQLMVEGRDSHEMQKLLHISYATVRNHIQNILDKLEVHTRVAAVVVAMRENLVEDPTRLEHKVRQAEAVVPPAGYPTPK